MKLRRYTPAPFVATILAVLFATILALAAADIYAKPAADSVKSVWQGKTKKVKPGRYAKAALEANVDVSGPERGRKFLRLTLPDGHTVKLTRKKHQNRGNGNALWQGTVSDQPDSEAILTVRNGHMAGRVRIKNDVYEIRPGKGGKHIIEQLDLDTLPSCDTDSDQFIDGSVDAHDVNNYSSAPITAQSSSVGLVTMDILAVYTAAARNKVGGSTDAIETQIQAAIDVSNTAFSESNMDTRFNLVHMEEITYTTQGDTSTDLAWVTDDSAIAALRDQYGADMVSLIVDTPDSCGTAWVQRSPGAGFSGYAFAATDIDCAVGNMTVTHEHGHNMGMEHNPENSSIGDTPENASYPWSFGYYVNGSFRTIMSYSSPCTVYCSRAARFSNPDVLYNGVPTGVTDQQENAKTGIATGPIIEAFRTSISGSDSDTLVNIRVAQPSDDVEESVATGVVSLDSSDLEFGYDGFVGAEQYLGLRFLNVGIPADAIVTNAYLEFAVDETGDATTSSEIRILAADNTSSFSTTAYDVSARTTEAGVVYWDIPAWLNIGETHTSPDLTSLVQSVVDREGWAAGNAMGFVISAQGDRTAESWDGSPTQAPLLHVDFQVIQNVAIDVLPADNANAVDPDDIGNVPVAVLSSANFDATQIDPSTLKFGSNEAAPATALEYIDVDAEFGLDTQTEFPIADSGIACSDTEVSMSGETYSGTLFIGSDSVDTSQCETAGCH